MKTTKIALFKGRKIRKTLYQNEWWFVVEDVVLALTDTVNPKDYINKMRIRDEELSKGYGQIVTPLSVPIEGGPQKMNCANTEGIFRIIQSIPSPKAEPFKRWLAKVGYERVQEIENPELATKRTRMLYKLKGYSDDWVEKRMRGIAIREELTDEWQKQGLIEWSVNSVPRKKIFLDERGGKKMQDIWEFKDPQYPQYPTEKSLDLLKFIIEASSNKGDLVLDCFAGSGTTLIAAQSLNRNWIGIDKSEQAIKIAQKRLNDLPSSLFSKIEYEFLKEK